MKSFTQITALLSTIIIGFTNAKNNNIYFNNEKVLSETHWKGMNISPDAPSHLSVISQGQFNEGLFSKYDKNYYYPASAGEGIDVYMFDLGFNFSYEEFSDNKPQIEIVIQNGGEINEIQTDKLYFGNSLPDHGTLTSAAVAGKTLGVAKKAKIHGVCLVEENQTTYDFLIDGLLSWLKYMKENDLIKPHKTVFNFSVAGITTIDEFENDEKFREIQELINEISNMGVVLVAGAGNDDVQSYDKNNNHVYYPCAFDNVICVGGVGNFIIPSIMNDEIDSSYYTVGKYEHFIKEYNITKTINSNYGDHVDIYAPYVFHYQGNFLLTDTAALLIDIDENYEIDETENGKVVKNLNTVFPGTSFSSPIVAGVAATLMSEFPEKKFTSKSMLVYLTEIGEKDIIKGIPEGYPNVFINNGKKIIYDVDSTTELDVSFLSEEDTIMNSDSEIEVVIDSEEVAVDDDSDSEVEDIIDSEDK